MDRINDKHIQEKGHRADCRKKQQGTRIKAALLAGLAGAVLANTFPGQIRNWQYSTENRRQYLHGGEPFTRNSALLMRKKTEKAV